jgi:hypothetical protein
VERLYAALVARTPVRADWLALVTRWCADGLQQLRRGLPPSSTAGRREPRKARDGAGGGRRGARPVAEHRRG